MDLAPIFSHPTALGHHKHQTDLPVPSNMFSLAAYLTVHGVLKATRLSGLPFPSAVDHVLSELSTITCPSWVALHSMAHSFIELDRLWSM